MRRGGINGGKYNLIFLHIPKTAGSTLHAVLERHYRRDQCFTVTGHAPQRIADFAALPPAVRHRVRLLKGHMPFGAHAYLAGESRYLTFLRDPVERVRSHYHYVRRNPGHYLHPRVVDEKLSLADYVESGLSGELNDGQVRLLAGHDQDLPFGACGAEHLARAKASIESHFALVGLTERFEESLALAAVVLGWSWTPAYANRNVNTDPREPLDADTRAATEAVNRHDIALYAWARERFAEQLDRHGQAVAQRVRQIRRASLWHRPVERALYALRHAAAR